MFCSNSPQIAIIWNLKVLMNHQNPVCICNRLVHHNVMVPLLCKMHLCCLVWQSDFRTRDREWPKWWIWNESRWDSEDVRDSICWKSKKELLCFYKHWIPKEKWLKIKKTKTFFIIENCSQLLSQKLLIITCIAFRKFRVQRVENPNFKAGSSDNASPN